MIVPMIKYSFIIHHQDADRFLQDLMDLGVLHVINKGEVGDDRTEQKVVEIRETEQALQRFEKRHYDPHNFQELAGPMPELTHITALEKEYEECIHAREGLETDLALMQPWGDFSWQSIQKLEHKTGLDVRFFSANIRQFQEAWLEQYTMQVVQRDNRNVHFIIYDESGGEDLPLIPLALPKMSLSEIEASLEEKNERITELGQLLDTYAANYTEDLKERIRQTKDELELMLTEQSTQHMLDDQLVLIEGWCPKLKQEELLNYAAKNKLVFLEHEPGEDDQPPVMLKNNRFTRLFEPIGEMFSLPAYSELDLTVFFAPFFLLFFGFCLGDAGYGVVMFTGASLAKLKLKGDSRKFATLAQLFGVSTTVIGFLSGTLFGIEMLKSPIFEPVHYLMFNQDQMFQIALIIGFIQIIFGMSVQVYKKVIFEGWLSAISRLGWIVLLLSLGDLYILKLSPQVSGVSVWLGVAMIVLFGAPKQGWLKSVGLGLADLYNITGVAGDLLSYIRLFALGVSSAILGLVVNDMAFSAGNIDYVGFILTGLVLLVGHTANLMLASLSAFVHPMRLTFVEFYKNVGFEGGGKPYKPFARKAKNKIKT